MSDEKDPISEIVEAVHDVRDFLKQPNVKTAVVYAQSTNSLAQAGTLAAAAAIVSGMLAVGEPAISTEQPVHKPDDQRVTQTQENALFAAGEVETLVNGSPPPDLFWSGNDDAPFWSGDDSASFWRSRSAIVRRLTMG